ncbi:ABC transporter substrate-binding protein [Sinosporangium siamense]|uniref:Uncharacterized protein n=1 Tax=Sinosporangium siamense TaxID=1367973 RepID=A0A919RBH4_9ACTN|nr:ABC transporter substrate-binding protein [Sinosporangium siamense]GII90432.1 hypothetical protein Ssi02_06630 [Sinosporangium siamense]
MPGSLLPAPRFPLTQIILWALDLGEERTTESPRARTAVYREKLREWRRQRVPFRSLGGRLEYLVRFLSGPTLGAALATVILTEWLDTAGPINFAILVGTFAAAIGLARLLAGFWFSGTFRYGWFFRQRYKPRKRSEELAGYLYRIGEAERDDVEVDRLLVNAFIEDLRLAYSRRMPWPGWGRSGYAVLHLGDAGEGSAGRRFLAVLHKVLTDTGLKVPLLIVAHSPEWSPALCGDHPSVLLPKREAAEDVRRAHGTWRTRTAHLAPCPYLAVDAKGIRGIEPAGAPPRRRRAISRLRPVGYWLIAGAAVLIPFAWGGWTVLRPCEPGLTAIEGECVGVSTATKNFDPALIPILNLIGAENDRIALNTKVFRVVYFGPLTQRPGSTDPGDKLIGTAAELVGVYARQKEYNQVKGDWKLMVEFANPGQDYAYADVAARTIAERVPHDRTIAAVVGLGWSRKAVKDAIGILNTAQIPGLSTTATAENLSMVDGDPSGYFYRLPPSNARQAVAAVHWLRALPVSKDKTMKEYPRVGILRFSDALELYSADLAEQFAKRYKGRGESSIYDFSDSAGLKKTIQKACDDGVEVLLYLGRGDQFPALKEGWGSHCSGKKVVILAGDDIANAVATEVLEHGERHSLDLRYIALSDPRPPNSTKPIPYYGTVVQRVLSETEVERGRKAKEAGRTPPVALPPDHAVLAHDATLAVTTAFDRSRSRGDIVDVRAGVQERLRGLKVDGASGSLEFASDRNQNEALKRPLWLMSVYPGQPLTAELSCTPVGEEPECGKPLGGDTVKPKEKEEEDN